MPKYTHVDKGLDLLKCIGVIKKFKYYTNTDSYTVFGDLQIPGIKHKIYNADELSKLSASELYARIIVDFNMNEDDNHKGFFYKVKNKLKKLSNAIINCGAAYWSEDHTLEIYNIMNRLINDGEISRSEMLRCNELWKKYKDE
ncbi:hypothetical protein HN385_08310 [archaeon]|jgi:hypothetical protein|nr:hypothetical protein [archaeon]MBT4207330.1 hypothetical protein [Candidatus Woesearchaeota archaeon]MBT4731316.1 hypothetical protein [Candidatus Woesearchaeota archaeon]MBT7557917.1 hypothetical protein [Candidatus Woesearchaeota archaeon]